MAIYRDSLKKHVMNFETENCAVYITADNLQVFNELHDAIDKVLMKYYATPTLESAPVDTETINELEEAIDKLNKEKI